MCADVKKEVQLEIAHILFIDTVGYSKLLINEQRKAQDTLNKIVRTTNQFLAAEATGRLIRLPTGDGMALVFYDSPESPVECASEISKALRDYPQLQLRMGIHSGPVSRVVDVNDRCNLAGAGINTAERVMTCADAGHILLSKRAADDLSHYQHWQPYLHPLGECEIKHGVKLGVVNFYTTEVGNAEPPAIFRRRSWKRIIKGGAEHESPRRRQLLIAAGLILAGAMVAVAVWSLSRHGGPEAAGVGTAQNVDSSGPAIPEKSIAVLPFENLSDDKQNAYFANGVQDEILTDLAKVADLKVISRTSVMPYKSGAERNLRDIAKQLGVAYVVEGSVQRASGRVRVSAQLIDARKDAHLWAEHYDRDLADVFAIQSELAEKIVFQLKAKLSPEEKAAIEEQPTADLTAYDLYLRAKALSASAAFNPRTGDNLLESAHLFDQAVARDPAFFLAYCQLASVHDQIYFFGVDHTPARLALAQEAVNAAQRLRPDSGETHLALAEQFYYGYLDFERAREELAAAGRALPNEPLVFKLTGFIDRRQGRWEESMRNLDRALELDPRNVSILEQISISYYRLRRFADMAAVLDRALALVPMDINVRKARGLVDLEWRADPRFLHLTIETILAEDPNAAGLIADDWLYLAQCERDWSEASRALAAMTAGGCRTEGVAFPRAWCEGVTARARGDAAAAYAAFTTARAAAEQTLREQPDYAEGLCVLGMIDAALGRKEEAIQEGRRAVELLPVAKDSINGALLMEYLAVIYAWTSEKDLALEQLSILTRIPSTVNYGTLCLRPYWDPLRGDPRFEKIVAALAPSGEKP